MVAGVFGPIRTRARGITSQVATKCAREGINRPAEQSGRYCLLTAARRSCPYMSRPPAASMRSAEGSGIGAVDVSE